jgi:hypothetical protein
MRERHPHKKEAPQRIQLRHPPRIGRGQPHRSQTRALRKKPTQVKTRRPRVCFTAKDFKTFTKFIENAYAFLMLEMLKCLWRRHNTAGENFMHTFRTRRPLLVKATQCQHPSLILTDSGQRKAYPGDWIIEGENHERYIVDNTFFQRTFAPVSWEPSSEGRHYGC